LDETDDALNDDTFGGGSAALTQKPVGKDFDFFGRTVQVADAISEEQARFVRQKSTTRAPPIPTYSKPAPKPARTGYERYKEPEYVPEMQVDANIWGTAPKRQTPAQESPATTPGLAPAGRKMVSLEEVEAAMRAQAKKPTQAQVSAICATSSPAALRSTTPAIRSS
jgi:DNA topoisomerase 2-associated protein PAT1